MMLHVLKNLDVFMIEFKDYLNQADTMLVDEEKLETIYLLNFYLCIDFIKDKNYTLFVISDNLGVDNFKMFLDENKIPYICKNISDLVLSGEININDSILDSLDEFNYEISDLFLEEIDDWIYQNTDIDIILDKISEKGIESLIEPEKKYLDNYNKV
jgi:hypothetical protein